MNLKRRNSLPFTAIVGQEKLKKALILNAINPDINGVLIKGERGTAKSTAVRAIAELLPEIEVVRDCSFNCNPNLPSLQCDVCRQRLQNGDNLPVLKRKMRVCDLPLSATEDRVIGTLDIEKALDEGIKALQPGILAEVNQGILYIDEVNLLDDHLVDTLLDAAAMGVNIIERENLSISHPSRFILVGTMNPEEGELRPQLLDRFGLQVDVKGIEEIEKRVEIIKRVERYNSSPKTFLEEWEDEQKSLRKKIEKAKEVVPFVEINDELLSETATLCTEFNVDGHRADILIVRCAKTIAAYEERYKVNINDIKEAAELVLPHRLKTQPFEEPEPPDQKIEELLEDGEKESNKNSEKSQKDEEKESSKNSFKSQKKQENQKGTKESTFEIKETDSVEIERKKDTKVRIGSGRRAKTKALKRGRYVKSRIPLKESDDIAVDATLRASAARGGKLDIKKEDIREKVREKRESCLLVFVVDASGSMAAKKRMEVAKGAVLALLKDSYQKRDKVAFVAFKGEEASVLLPPTSSHQLAASKLKELPTGKKTPLSDGMYKGMKVLERELKKDENLIPILVLVSDGKGNVPINKNVKEEVGILASKLKEKGIHLVVIDTETGLAKVGYNREIAEASGGEYHLVEELSSETVVDKVEHRIRKITNKPISPPVPF